MTAEEFDIYWAIMLDGALNNGFLISVSDHAREMATTTLPESQRRETPLDLGLIVMTPGAGESLSDDDIISALRRLRWGDYGNFAADVVALNDDIIASGTIEPIVGVYMTESCAWVRVETYTGRYTEVLLPQDARWDPNMRAAAQTMKGENPMGEVLIARCNDCNETWSEDCRETCENCGSDNISTIVDASDD